MAQSGKASSYTGAHTRTLDDKARLTIPSEWRSAHEESDQFLATSQQGYVAILPPAEADALEAKFAKIPLNDTAGQNFAARFFARAQRFSFDKAGRVILRAELLKHAGIAKEAVLVGSGNKFNLYSPETWAKVDAPASPESDAEIMRRFDI